MGQEDNAQEREQHVFVPFLDHEGDLFEINCVPFWLFVLKVYCFCTYWVRWSAAPPARILQRLDRAPPFLFIFCHHWVTNIIKRIPKIVNIIVTGKEGKGAGTYFKVES